MIGYFRQFSLAIAIATLLPVFSILPDGAVATPRNQPRGCLDRTMVNNNGIVREEYQAGHFVLSDGRGSHINVRANPSVNSPIRYVAPFRRGVSVSRQVVGKDGYCWIQVEGGIWDEAGIKIIGSFSGWVRGDLLRQET
ncbi:SH3 domain-containing protein [Limnofasciculus baicalensis]|uniref:SH3b domain-containing protein n=1 Tax=Limnofasciculus baicalensis BBK-W-15 TaxID=2699891 RepID=A0AAE3GYF1_9CYAN|nr:hypothetical protein [Limnofasciculus baicalensis]MCP2732138.1 hypothetical protein [Limnofasciculus baicalensis BBK-W-15]